MYNYPQPRGPVLPCQQATVARKKKAGLSVSLLSFVYVIEAWWFQMVSKRDA
jgi:hypothetical protein